MALQITIETNIGHDATYHRAESLDVNIVLYKGEVIVQAFENKQARDEGKHYLTTVRIVLTKQQVGRLKKTIGKEIYKMVKESEKYKDAVDILED